MAGIAALGASALTTIGPALAGIAAAAGPILLVAGAIGGLIFLLVQNREKIMPFIHTIANFFGHQLKDAGKAQRLQVD